MDTINKSNTLNSSRPSIEKFSSTNPATGETIWEGNAANFEEVENAIFTARRAFLVWSAFSLNSRIEYLQRFQEELKKNRVLLTKTISLETGKPLWEANTEVGAMINKIPISIEAFQDRCKDLSKKLDEGQVFSVTEHKPHGVLAVMGPFNFPGHLPNGHIVPALLAGNTVVFKPSQLTPLVGEKMMECWKNAKIPEGVINLVQGGTLTGKLLAEHPGLNGLLFTGSAKTGQILLKLFSDSPEKILALELGGNNPLIVHQVDNIKVAVYHTLQSAYLTAGQRCTCARRLIVTKNELGKKFVEALIAAIPKIKVGAFTEDPEPFMGPLVSIDAANKVMASYEELIKLGGKPLVPLTRKEKKSAFVTPGLIDVSSVSNPPDEEIFGPVLQLKWVEDFEEAIQEANNTEYGLAAGLFCPEDQLFQSFLQKSRAGVVNWNRPLTGASSSAPFGGIGKSGNCRPSAYYAADYCAYPVAILKQKTLEMPDQLIPGIEL